MSEAILSRADGTVLYPFPKANAVNEAAEPDQRTRTLSRTELIALRVVAALTGLLGLVGFVVSFATVEAAARPVFGPLAFLLPLGVDLGIAVFSILGLVLARLDMPLSWLKFVPWSLVAATIYLNVAHQETVFGRIAHAVLPALWVVAVEVATHAIRVRAGLASGRRMDHVRRSRWLLAPVSTALLVRRMILWEIRSYPAALERERSRLLAKTDLQDTYGRFAWRWKAPRRTRALYRLGELAPTEALPTEPQIQPAQDKPEPTPVKRSRPAKRARARKPNRRTVQVDDLTELLPQAAQAAEAVTKRRERLTRDRFRQQLSDDGWPLGNAKAGQLLELHRNQNNETSETEGTEG